jgi:hypothetical protein
MPARPHRIAVRNQSLINQQVLQILTPGVALRIIDSYIVTATGTGGAVNWALVNSSLSTLVDNFIASGLIHLTPSLTVTQIKSFTSSLAQIISNYKLSTNRASL